MVHDDVRAEILLDELSEAAEQHLLDCDACTGYAARLSRLDGLLAPMVLIEPPAALQVNLLQIAKSAAVQPETARQRVMRLVWSPTAAALAVAGITTGLALWQVMGWLAALATMLGNVPYALEVLMGSPAVTAVAASAGDLVQLAIWVMLGVGAWLVSDISPLRQTRPRAPRVV